MFDTSLAVFLITLVAAIYTIYALPDPDIGNNWWRTHDKRKRRVRLVRKAFGKNPYQHERRYPDGRSALIVFV